MGFLTIFLVFFVLIVSYLVFKRNRNKKLPPGPIPLPVVGNLFSFAKNQTETYSKYAEKYGDIYQVQLGPMKVILLNDVNLIKEAFSQLEFSGRPDMKLFCELFGNKMGIISAEGRVWEEQRRFTLRHLRDFGFGKNYMENLIMEDVKEFMDWLARNEGQSISINKKIGLVLLNSLWAITSGQRYNHDDPKLLELLDKIVISFREISENPFVFFMQFLLELAPKKTGWSNFKSITAELKDHLFETVEEHLKTISRDQPRDFIDSYLDEIYKTSDPKSSFYKDTGRQGLLAVVLNIFVAGFEPTTNTLSWAILYLVMHPNVQEKLFQEIDQVIGKNRLVTLADRARMPYTESIINETVRKSSIIPQGQLNKTLKDTHLKGYFIEKGSIIAPNMYYIHHNPKLWTDPEKFIPERFLTPGGKLKKNENLIGFGLGKRSCIGENMARDQLFLFLTNIFQKYQVIHDPHRPMPSLEPEIGFILRTKDYFCIMRERI